MLSLFLRRTPPLGAACTAAGVVGLSRRQRRIVGPILPEVGVATIAPARSASRTIQRTRRSGRRGRTAAARKRLSAARRLQGRRPRAGRAAVRDRPAPVPDRARSRQCAAAAAVRPRASRTCSSRVQTLIDAHATSQEELDNARATAEQARADLQAADAAVADAKLNLGFTEVRARSRAASAARSPPSATCARGRHAADDRRVAEPVYVFRLRRTELPALQRAARRSETSRDRRRSGARGPRERDGLPAGHRRLPRQPARPATARSARACGCRMRTIRFAGPVCARAARQRPRPGCAARRRQGRAHRPDRKYVYVIGLATRRCAAT